MGNRSPRKLVETVHATDFFIFEEGATATEKSVLIGPVQSGFGLYFGCMDRTCIHYSLIQLGLPSEGFKENFIITEKIWDEHGLTRKITVPKIYNFVATYSTLQILPL